MDNANGLLKIGAGLGYMRPSPLLRSERKRKQITLAANLQTHKDKLVKTLPTDVEVPLAKRRKQGEEGISVSVSSSPLSSPPLSRSPSPLTISPHTKEKTTAKGPLVKKKEIQPLDLNLQRWQKINKYVAASQQSTLLLTQFMIVEEDVAKHLLAEDASASVEFLTIQLAIAVGAHLDGDNQSFKESWTKARNQLSELFDKSDYAVARALFLMGGVSIFLKGEEEQGSYYLLLAQMMCESLGMVNSDVYLRLLCYSALFDLRKGNLDKTIQHIHKLRDALELPYCSDPSFLGLKGNESFHFPRRSSVGLLAQNAKNAAAYARIPYLLADMLQGVASCLYCWKAGEQRDLVASRLLKCMSNIMKELVDGEAATCTPGESSNPPSVNHCVGPSSYALDLRLIVTSLTADTLWQIGCMDLALQWAISFLYFSKTNAFAKLLSPAVLLSRSVLTIFFETGNFLLLQAQLEVLKPLQTLYVPLRGIIQSFEHNMKAATSTVSLGLLPTDVLNEHMCHIYTTNTNPRATTITTTTTPTKKTSSPCTKATTITTTTSAASVNASCVTQPSGLLSSTNIGPTEIQPEVGDILAALVGDDDTPVSDSWITNLGDIEDIQCEDFLKDFGFDD